MATLDSLRDSKVLVVASEPRHAVPLANRLQREGSEVQMCDFSNHSHDDISEITQRVKQDKPDVILVHNAFPPKPAREKAYLDMLAALGGEVPVVVADASAQNAKQLEAAGATTFGANKVDEQVIYGLADAVAQKGKGAALRV